MTLTFLLHPLDAITCAMQHIVYVALLWALCLPNFASADATGEVRATDFNPDKEHAAFINSEAYAEQYLRLLELEQQALALIEDEPLKIASIGAAILDTYPASQTGHYAMSRYYEHVEAKEAQATHEARLDAVQAAMLASGDGNPQQPFKVMTIYDAQTYARSIEHSPVGSIYQTSDGQPLSYLLVARPEQAKLRQVFFDVRHALSALVENESSDAVQANTSWAAIRILGTRLDSAAQTAIGALLAQNQNFDSSIGWLKVASRTGNILANNLLARIYAQLSNSGEDEAARAEYRELSLENYLHSIALGSTNSMYTLAGLYLSDYFGEENRTAAIPLLQQAGELGHADALLYLAHIYNVGQFVDADRDTAIKYYEQGASLENPDSVIAYARFLVSDAARGGKPVETQIVDQLTKLTKADNAEAMILLGNLYARGVNVAPSNRRALRWYRRAIKAEPEDADIVNEVAWTLTVTDVPKLQRARYAHRLMERLMTENEAANERPEYLDTWAATYAATGDFERAIEIQNQAIQTATAQEREDVMEILKTHLDQFEANETITEPAP